MLIALVIFLVAIAPVRVLVASSNGLGGFGESFDIRPFVAAGA
jgi:hypothetical protein